MKNLNLYITEKFKISKDIKNIIRTPKNFDELKDLVETYFWEWVDNDEYFTVADIYKPEMKKVYNSVLRNIQAPQYGLKKTIRTVLPANFRKYMNKKYNLDIDEKY